MNLQTEWISYGNSDKYIGYVAKLPQINESAPAVIVIQEIWGVDDHIKDVTERFAQAGYVAFAPDLYAVHGERPDALQGSRIEAVKQFLDSLPPTAWANIEERETALKKLPSEQQTKLSETLSTLFGGLNPTPYVEQLVATSSFLSNDYPLTKGQGVASVGFCLGGALSAKLATQDPNLKGAVIFYGNAPSPDEIKNISCPLMGFYGGLDQRITSQVPSFAEQMKASDKSFTYHIYESAHHAFFNDTRASYHVTSARHALAQTLQFFSQVME